MPVNVYAQGLINLSAGKPAETVKIITGLTTRYPENEKYLRLLAKAQTTLSNPAGASVTYSQLINSGVADAPKIHPEIPVCFLARFKSLGI